MARHKTIFVNSDILVVGGGMGGCGGTIIIVTEETTLAGICDVSGGVGGLPSEGGGNQGDTGNPGAVIAFNPMLAAQIPV